VDYGQWSPCQPDLPENSDCRGDSTPAPVTVRSTVHCGEVPAPRGYVRRAGCACSLGDSSVFVQLAEQIGRRGRPSKLRVAGSSPVSRFAASKNPGIAHAVPGFGFLSPLGRVAAHCSVGGASPGKAPSPRASASPVRWPLSGRATPPSLTSRWGSILLGPKPLPRLAREQHVPFSCSTMSQLKTAQTA